MVRSPFQSQLPKMSSPAPSKKDSMAVLAGFLEAGSLAPIIGRTYALDEVTQAIRRLIEGNAMGRIVISVRPGTTGS